MPAEKFWYAPDAVEGGSPDLIVSWGDTPRPAVLINGMPADRSGLNRLIRTLRKARDQVYGADE